VDTRPEKLEARGEKKHWNGGAETKGGGKAGKAARGVTRACYPQGSAIHGPRVKGRGWDNDWEGKKGEEMWGAAS